MTLFLALLAPFGGLLSGIAVFAATLLFLQRSRPAIPGWDRIRNAALRSLDQGRTRRKARAVRKRMRDLQEAFPQALGIAISALRTGQTLPQTLEYLSLESAPPLREEAARMVSEMALGASPEAALERAVARNPEFTELGQFLESYRLSRITGANLAHLLQTLLEGMEEKNRILRKMDAMTAQARLSGRMMGLLPVFLLLAVGVMDPGLVLPLFTERAGWGILLAAALLEAIGFLWIKRLMRIEV